MNLQSYQLNADQQFAAAQIKRFLKEPDFGVFTLTGGPGTGKTFMLKTVLEEYKGSVQGATVSHAAKNILQESLGSRVECITLANLLGLNMSISDDGQIRFVRPKTNKNIKLSKIGDAKLLIIDEASQIEDDTYRMIVQEAESAKVKIIAVGDPYQLPPVEQNHDSKFFQKIGATLEIPMRFQGPIADLASVYRTQIDNINNEAGFDKWALNTATRRRDNVIDNTGYLFTNQLNEMIELAADDIKGHPESTSYARVLAFKNESVAEINRRVREKIYGENLDQFEKSELIICNGGYSAQVALVDRPGNRRVPVLYNGQILTVASHKHTIGPEEVPCVLVNFKNFANTGGHPIYVVSNTLEARLAYDKILSRLLQEAKRPQDPRHAREAWIRYYSFIDSFAYFDYAYSVNLYKAQGQTLNNVYVCEGEVMDVKPLTWKQKFQALYVAMTRAKEKLFIYNKEF